MKDNHKKLIFYIVPYLILFIVLAGIEVVVRSTQPFIPSIQVYVSGRTHGDDDIGATTFEGDPLLGWRLVSGLKRHWWEYSTFSTNNQHLRQPYDLAYGKQKDTLRVITLGDSVTFGYYIPVSFPKNPYDYNKEDKPYARLLEAKLKEKYPGKKIEVINMAVPGYTSHQGLAWLRRDIEQYKPDILTVNYGWNDTDERALPDKETLPAGGFQVFIRWLSAQSQAVIYASRWLREVRSSDKEGMSRGGVNRVSSEDYVKNILAIADVAKNSGAIPLVIGQVYRDAISNPRQAKDISRNRDLLRKAAKEAGIHYLEIPELTEHNQDRNRNLFGELVHPNIVGHRIMTDRILEHFVKNNMIRF